MLADSVKAKVVELILRGDVGDALDELSKRYAIKSPKIRVGTVKGHRKAWAVYRQRDKTIYGSSREVLLNPFIVLHEYYHYLQSERYGKKGNEKYANKFAQDFFSVYSNYSPVKNSSLVIK
jgi:hypothetical protein